jgi:hypothetical protein
VGLLEWMRNGTGDGRTRPSVSRQPQVPAFEQLEPRVLLSADASFIPDFQPVETFEEQVVSVDIGEVTSGEWLVASEEESGIRGQEAGGSASSETALWQARSEGTEEDGQQRTEDRQIERSSEPQKNSNQQLITNNQTGLPVSQIEIASNLSVVQRSEFQSSVAHASEDVKLEAENCQPLHPSPFTPHTSVLGPALNRGPPTEIVFIDSSLNLDYQLENACQPGVVVSVFDADRGGMLHITDILSSYANLSAIHIVSHGAPGQVNLGAEILDSVALHRYADEIGTWGDALVERGDILFYGCSIAQGESGSGFLDQIAELTGADLAASINPTGNVGLGGDWELEIATGLIEAEFPYPDSLLESYHGILGLIINEVHYDPAGGLAGDANGDGTRDSSEDEFVEIVNDSTSSVDISGSTLSDDDGDNFIFPASTILNAGQAAVLFGGGTPTGTFGAALMFTDDGTIGNGLANGGDLVELRDSSGTLIDSVGYGSAGGVTGGSGQSATRDPDLTGSFVNHSTATGSGGALFSPGTKIDESSFAEIVSVVINEVDTDTPGTDAVEFIELYDGGIGNTSIDGLVLVLYNGDDEASYGAYDLDGYSTDANGYFVIGDPDVPNVAYSTGFSATSDDIENGADAVALYWTDATDFPNDTPVTSANLIDAIVYDTGQPDASGLLDVLTPGQAQIDENGQGDKENHSNSRVPDGGTQLDTSTYVQQIPTPGTSNLIVEFTSDVYQVSEDVGTSTQLILTRNGTGVVSEVQVSITGGTATSGSDYDGTSFPVTVTFSDAETSKTVAIPITNDTVYEYIEEIQFQVTAVNNVTISSQDTASLEILDDDFRFVPVDPIGSLIYEGEQTIAGDISFDRDEDSYSFYLDSNQLVAVLVSPDDDLQPSAKLIDPNGVTLSSVSSTSVGEDLVLNSAPTTTAGLYSVVFSSISNTTGAYSVDLFLNTVLELESHDGPNNGSFATAQDMNASFLGQGNGVETVAVLGQTKVFTQNYNGINQDATSVFYFDFGPAGLPLSEGVLTVSTYSNVNSVNRYLTVDGEAIIHEVLFDSGSGDIRTAQINLSRNELESLAADGTISFTVTASQAFMFQHPLNYLSLSLDYWSADDAYSFELEAGQTAALVASKSLQRIVKRASATHG